MYVHGAAVPANLAASVEETVAATTFVATATALSSAAIAVLRVYSRASDKVDRSTG